MFNIDKLLKWIKGKIKSVDSKKLIEKAAIIAIIGVICMIAGSVIFKDYSKKNIMNTFENKDEAKAVETMKLSNEENKNEVESNLQNILSKIKGAGKVEVMVTFYSGNESIPAIDVNTNENNTQEKDKEGGSRVITQSDKDKKVVYEENDGVKKPFIVKEILPQVKGVVIVADGANDAEVKSNLTKATSALLDLAVHKIQVFQRDSK